MTIRRSLRAGAGSDLLIVRSIRTNDSYVAADVILNFRKKATSLEWYKISSRNFVCK